MSSMITQFAHPEPSATQQRRRSLSLAHIEQSSVGHALLSILDQMLVSCTSFLIGRCVAVSDPDAVVARGQLGSLFLGIGTFWLLAGIANALFWTPYVSRAAHMSPRKRARFRAATAAMSFAFGGALSVVCLVAAGVVAIAAPSESWLWMLLAACGPLSLVYTVREYARRTYVADFRGLRLLGLDALVCSLQLAIVYWMNAIGQLNAVVAIGVVSLAALPAVIVAARQIASEKFTLNRLKVWARSNWSYGKWMLVVAVAFLASDLFLRLLVAVTGGKEEVGSFAGPFLIVAIANPLLLALTAFARSIASRSLAAGTPGDLVRRTIRSTGWTTLFASAVFVFLATLGDKITALVLSESYVNSTLMIWLALAVCLEGVAVPGEAAFVALENGRLLSIVALVRLLVSLVIGAVLIPSMGATGMAIAMAARGSIVIALYGCGLARARNYFADLTDSQTLTSGTATAAS